MFITTDQFLVSFNLESLQDLPDREQLEDMGLAATSRVLGTIVSQICCTMKLAETVKLSRCSRRVLHPYNGNEFKYFEYCDSFE